MKAASRTLTTLAVGFLMLDAVLLGYGGIAEGRLSLVAAGGVCALGSVLVVLGWRRYRRTLAEVDAARRELHTEVESLRELLHPRHGDT